MLELTDEQIAELKAAMQYREPEESDQPIADYSGYDVYEALASSNVTPELAYWLHNNGLNWQMTVRKP